MKTMNRTERELLCDEIDGARDILRARLSDAVITTGVNIDKLIDAVGVYVDARIALMLLKD